jgi:heme a synthase
VRLRASAIGLVTLILCQIYLGALVAGLRAGLIYNTWPLIDGGLVPAPSELFFQEPWWRNFFENPLTVQFVHRTMAYAVWIAAVAHAIDVARNARGGASLVPAITLAAAVTLQAALGIVLLLQQAPIGLALAHQAMAVAVLAIAVVHAERLSRPRNAAALARPLADAA